MTFFLSVCLLVIVLIVYVNAQNAFWLGGVGGSIRLDVDIINYRNTDMQIISCWDHMRNRQHRWEASGIWPNCPILVISNERKIACFDTTDSLNYYIDINKNNQYDYPVSFVSNVNILISMTENYLYNTGKNDKIKYINSDICTVRFPDDTAQRIIMAGFYVASMEKIDLLGRTYVMKTTVQSCERGTWMTCQETHCHYKFPILHPNGELEWNEYGQIHFLNKGFTNDDKSNLIPIGKCYPCKYGIGILHYANYTACKDAVTQTYPFCSSNPMITERDSVICKGGFFPPIKCPENSRADEFFLECVCINGKYMDNGVCKPCPIAHFCVAGKKYRCEDDTYQDLEGSSVCWPCNYYTIQASCLQNFLPAKCTYANDPVNMTYLKDKKCVSCSQCKNNVINNAKVATGESPMYLDCYDP